VCGTAGKIACTLSNCMSSACSHLPVYTLLALNSDPFFYFGMLSDERVLPDVMMTPDAGLYQSYKSLNLSSVHF
jgi:hypothetical protein